MRTPDPVLLCEVYRRESMRTGPLVGRLRVDGDKVTGLVAPELIPHGRKVYREAYCAVHSGLDMAALASVNGRAYLFVPTGTAPVPPPLPVR